MSQYQQNESKQIQEIAQYALTDNEIIKLTQYFVSRDEKYISSLGNGYIMNYLANGNIRRGFAVISNKRVYFRGSCLGGTGKKLVRTDEERTVDVKNITGSGFVYTRYWGMLIAWISIMIINMIPSYFINIFFKESLYILMGKHPDFASFFWVAALPLNITLFIVSITKIVKYFSKRKTFFRIEYAGGCIAFNVSYYAKVEIDDFQKQLRRTKDLAEESSAKVLVTESPVQPSGQSSVLDDLQKYAELLNEGLISQEEYDTMKKNY